MKKLLLSILAASLLFTACSNNKTTEKKEETTKETETETTTTESETKDTEETKTDETSAKKVEVSKENPLVVDKENKTISIFATVNGKFLNEGTRHLVISESGKIAEMSLFKTPVTPTDFYNAFLEVGATPGDNVTPENAATTTTEGSKLNVTLTIDGKENIDINDAVPDSNGKALDLRFSGNIAGADEYQTGCISCLDSCFVGITSNANYPLGAIEDKKEVEFIGNKDVLKEDGKEVIITYAVQD